MRSLILVALLSRSLRDGRWGMIDLAKVEAQFNRVCISEKDFIEASEFLTAYRSRHSTSVRRAILVAAIVAYSRPFTANNGGASKRTTPTLIGNPKKILADQVDYMLHTRILEVRNQAIAHSDEGRNPVRRVMGQSTGFVMSARLFDVLSENISVRSFRVIVKRMITHCRTTLSQLNGRLFKYMREAETFGSESEANSPR
jgi:hypothetical protein